LTHLYVAVYNNYLEVSKLLIEKGANVNAKDNEGENSFDLAIKYQKEEVADYLKSVGEKNKMFVS
jgi:ankyrin repeat protein